MSTKSLRWLGVIIPLLFWAAVMALRAYLAPHVPVGYEAGLELALVGVGGAIFSSWVANRFDAHEAEISQRARQLEALRQATLSLTTELELDRVLTRVVEVSRTLAAARYAALGVVNAESGEIEQFITSGLTEQERSEMGPEPSGRGLLGAILTERRTLRIDDIASDPRSVGYPAHHPPMRTMLGVPLIFKGQVFGNLYLADKVNPSGGPALRFTDQDERTLEMFAAHASIAIENARLHRQNQLLAIMQERERFGMNLHDGIIQSIYAVGLILDDAKHRIESEPASAREQVSQSLRGLNDVIRDIRCYIMDLRPQRFEGRTLDEGLEELASAVTERAGLRVDLALDPTAAAYVSAEQTAELLHVAQEAITNVRKHSGAETVTLRLSRGGGQILMSIEDDGSGFDVFRTASKSTGNGLRNMQDRARVVNGELEIDSQAGHGTRIVVSVPYSRRTRTA